MKRAYGKSFTRRHAVKIAGIGLMGATSGASAEAMNSQLRDPVTTYPRPPFKRQSQPWPGLASKMEPPPDHGEESYRGAGRLAGRKALISAAIRAWAEQLPLRTPGKERTSRSITCRWKNRTRAM